MQYATEEKIAVAVKTLIFVMGKNKHALEDHFYANNELETILLAKGKDVQVDYLENVSALSI